MKLFDSHCHLDDKTYASDLDSVIERAHSAGVAHLMTIGVNGKTSARAVELAQSHPDIYASVGVHPHDAGNCRESVIDDLINLAENPKVRAWGEIGLDFNRMYSPRKDQEKWFRKQLETAVSLDLPLLSRSWNIIGRSRLPAVSSCLRNHFSWSSLGEYMRLKSSPVSPQARTFGLFARFNKSSITASRQLPASWGWTPTDA